MEKPVPEEPAPVEEPGEEDFSQEEGLEEGQEREEEALLPPSEEAPSAEAEL